MNSTIIEDLLGLAEIFLLVQILQRDLHHQPVEGCGRHRGKDKHDELDDW